jgi:hypothetical protein
MSRRFYAAWSLAVALAVVLPSALPYVVWPPARFDGADGSADCAGVAKAYAAHATNPAAAAMWPLSVDIEHCWTTAADGLPRFDAQVDARGPYGIPFATATVSERGVIWHEQGGGAALGLIALLAGATFASFPFMLAILSRTIRRYPAPAV